MLTQLKAPIRVFSKVFIIELFVGRAKIVLNCSLSLSLSLNTAAYLTGWVALSTISHINYWDQLNSWKNFWKFWNGLLCRNKSGPSPLLNVAVYWQSSNTEACAKKLSQIIANNIDNGGREIGLRIYVRYCIIVTRLFKHCLKSAFDNFTQKDHVLSIV